MGLAGERAEEHAALLRLAAGGFRDMTRIACGHPAIWLDICAENRPAILAGARRPHRRPARDARRRRRPTTAPACTTACSGPARPAPTCPAASTSPSELAEVRIPIPDRPGAAAEVFTLAAELGVNIASFEVVHSVEGNRGVAVVLVDAAAAELYRGGLIAAGYRPAVQRLD